MARRATKDTYGLEVVGGTAVRRIIKAGDFVPEHWQVEEGSVEEADAGERVGGVRTHGSEGPYPEVNEKRDELQAESLENTRRLQNEAVEETVANAQRQQEQAQGDQPPVSRRSRRQAAQDPAPAQDNPSASSSEE